MNAMSDETALWALEEIKMYQVIAVEGREENARMREEHKQELEELRNFYTQANQELGRRTREAEAVALHLADADERAGIWEEAANLAEMKRLEAESGGGLERAWDKGFEAGEYYAHRPIDDYDVPENPYTPESPVGADGENDPVELPTEEGAEILVTEFCGDKMYSPIRATLYRDGLWWGHDPRIYCNSDPAFPDGASFAKTGEITGWEYP